VRIRTFLVDQLAVDRTDGVPHQDEVRCAGELRGDYEGGECGGAAAPGSRRLSLFNRSHRASIAGGASIQPRLATSKSPLRSARYDAAPYPVTDTVVTSMSGAFGPVPTRRVNALDVGNLGIRVGAIR